jgi:hypothetical protein
VAGLYPRPEKASNPRLRTRPPLLTPPVRFVKVPFLW